MSSTDGGEKEYWSKLSGNSVTICAYQQVQLEILEIVAQHIKKLQAVENIFHENFGLIPLNLLYDPYALIQHLNDSGFDS